MRCRVEFVVHIPVEFVFCIKEGLIKSESHGSIHPQGVQEPLRGVSRSSRVPRLRGVSRERTGNTHHERT